MKDNGVIEEVERIVVLLFLDTIPPSPLLFYSKLYLYKTIEHEEVSKRIQLAFNLLFSFELCFVAEIIDQHWKFENKHLLFLLNYVGKEW